MCCAHHSIAAIERVIFQGTHRAEAAGRPDQHREPVHLPNEHPTESTVRRIHSDLARRSKQRNRSCLYRWRANNAVRLYRRRHRRGWEDTYGARNRPDIFTIVYGQATTSSSHSASRLKNRIQLTTDGHRPYLMMASSDKRREMRRQNVHLVIPPARLHHERQHKNHSHRSNTYVPFCPATLSCQPSSETFFQSASWRSTVPFLPRFGLP
jgi:hypothetical protein